MNRVRSVFLEPFWGFLFALLPWVLLLPLLLSKAEGQQLSIHSIGFEIILTNFLNYALSASFLSILGFILIKLFNQLNVLVKENYLVGLVISVLGSIMLLLDGFSVSCIAVLFYTLGLFWLCNSPKEGEVNRYVFNAGFFLFLTVLIDAKFLIIAPLCLVLLLFLRTFTFRTVVVFLSALMVVIVLVEQLNYIVNGGFIDLKELVSFQIQYESEITEIQALNLIGLFVFQLVLAIFSFSNLLLRLSNKLKAVMRILFYGLIILTTLLLLEKFRIGSFQNIIYLLPIMTVLITVNVMFIKNKWLFRINIAAIIFSLVLFFLKVFEFQ